SGRKISSPTNLVCNCEPSKRMTRVSRIAATVATRSCSTMRTCRGVRSSRLMRRALLWSCRAQLYAICRQAQKRGGKGVPVPAQIGGQPAEHAETGLPLPALEPPGRDLGDRPAEPVALHQQLDRIAKAAVRFDDDAADDPAREQAEAAAGIVRRQAGEVVEREGGGAHQHRLEPGAADHVAAGNEAAGAD